MPTGVIATIPRLRFVDGDGRTLAGGSVEVYAAGTTDPENTWQDRALTIFNENPVPLDGDGSCVVWLDSAKTYKIVVKDIDGVTLWTQDDIVGGGVDDSVELNAPLIQAAVDAAQASADSAAASAAAAAASIGSVDGSVYWTTVDAGPTWTIPVPFITFTGAFIGGLKYRPTEFVSDPVAGTVTLTTVPISEFEPGTLVDLHFVPAMV